MKPIDIFVTCFLRQFYTQKTLEYLEQRTKYPYRLFVINNGGNDEVIDEAIKQNKIFLALKLSSNIGIHASWNTALAFAESEYFITSDNDLLVPQLEPDWLTQLVKFMDERPNYGAISLHPHIFIGRDVLDPNDPEDVKEVPHCGAVFRIMRRDAVWKAGGWEKVIRTSRNNEESTIAGRLNAVGYKVGICTRIRVYHMFGENWGYPETLTPHEHGHRIPGEEIWPPPEKYDRPELYNDKTWMPL